MKLKARDPLKILFIGRRNFEFPNQFKNGESHIGPLQEDFTHFGNSIKVGNFQTDAVLYLTPTNDRRLIVETETSYFLLESVQDCEK